MSWNKNTIVSSDIDSIVKVLQDLAYPYVLEDIGSVMGRGLNDDNNLEYVLRQLTYKNTVIREVMIRNYDCDADDYLSSRRYVKGKEPPIVLSYFIHDSDFCCGENKDCNCCKG